MVPFIKGTKLLPGYAKNQKSVPHLLKGQFGEERPVLAHGGVGGWSHVTQDDLNLTQRPTVTLNF